MKPKSLFGSPPLNLQSSWLGASGTALVVALLASGFVAANAAAPVPDATSPGGSTAQAYRGVPYSDAVYHGGPQPIPGRLQNEYYDTLEVTDAEKSTGAGEGITYHDTDNKNDGSGALNGTGSYLKEFRRFESPDISYVKFNNPETSVDDTPFNLVKPDAEALYLGWIAPGEWVRYTVAVQADGVYTLTTSYTSKFGGRISFDCDGADVSGPLTIPSTFDAADPIEWRQAHHWNKLTGLGKIRLTKGPHVLTLHFLDHPVMNFDYMEFVKAE